MIFRGSNQKKQPPLRYEPLFVDVITRDENTGKDKVLEQYHRKVNGECSILEK
tara:strand:- start:505 stop:663 length:159 start_codon:yes stop_codon:yes gene_type:complete